MKTLGALYHIIRADFLERVRGYGFWITLLFTIFLTYFFLPSLNAPLYPLLVLGGYRPIYNSAWIGFTEALVMIQFLPLFAFYLLKGSIERDRHTGVGEIIATTPLRSTTYTLGKWLSNMAVSVAMVLIILAASVALQLLRGEDYRIDLTALALPLLVVLLPALAMVAALAVLFECINWLRGGLGNGIGFFVVIVVAGITSLPVTFDVMWPSLYQSCSTHFAHCNAHFQMDLASGSLAEMPTFIYPGLFWPVQTVINQSLFVLASAVLAGAAGLLFHRFDPARSVKSWTSNSFDAVKNAVMAFITQPDPGSGKADLNDELDPEQSKNRLPVPITVALAPAVATANRPLLFYNAVRGEIRLALKGRRWWWYVGAILLAGASLIVPSRIGLSLLLPLDWLWPIFVWSSMGGREERAHARQIVYSVPHPLSRQLMATWVTGVLVALLMSSGVIFRLALDGLWPNAGAVLVGALFLPSMALAMGCWSGGSKLFEGAFLFMWYMNVVHGFAHFDFMGRIAGTVDAGLPWVYAGLTAMLLLFSVLGRRRQLTI